MSVLTKDLRESSGTTRDDSKPHQIAQHHIEYYLLRRKQLIEEARHIEKVLLDQGAITKRFVLQRAN